MSLAQPALDVASPAAPASELARLRAGATGLGLGIGLIGLSVASHLASPLLAAPLCILLALALTTLAPALAPIAVICGFLFQSLFIAFLSPGLTPEGFESIRGYSFLVAASVWAVCGLVWLREGRAAPPALRRRVAFSLWAFALVVAYFGVGLARGVDARSAVIYLRNVGLPIMLVQMGYVLGWRGAPSLLVSLQMLAWLVLGLGLFEAAFRDAWLQLTNGDVYWALAMRDLVVSGFTERVTKLSGFVPVDVKDYFLVNFLNTSLLAELELKVYRVNGPNHHPISYAYALTFLALVMAANRRWLYLAACFPLMMLVGSKGALIVFAFGSLFPLAARHLRRDLALWASFAALAAFLAYAIWTGRNSGDFHVLGFFGGLKGFLENPLGRGLGFGGNLSDEFTQIDWAQAQAEGATQIAAESALGVALYQMGVFGALVFGLFAHLAVSCWRAWRAGGEILLSVCAFALLAILANGVLQEEAAFSPLALGLLAFFAAIRLARRDGLQAAGYGISSR